VVEHSVERESGKRGRVVGIVEDTPATQEVTNEEVVKVLNPAVDVHSDTINDNIVHIGKSHCNQGYS
jgi:hypothetical protein